MKDGSMMDELRENHPCVEMVDMIRERNKNTLRCETNFFTMILAVFASVVSLYSLMNIFTKKHDVYVIDNIIRKDKSCSIAVSMDKKIFVVTQLQYSTKKSVDLCSIDSLIGKTIIINDMRKK